MPNNVWSYFGHTLGFYYFIIIIITTTTTTTTIIIIIIIIITTIIKTQSCSLVIQQINH